MPANDISNFAIGPFASAETVAGVAGAAQGLLAQVEALQARLMAVESVLGQMDKSLSGIIQEEIRHSYIRDPSLNTLNGLQLALCVATDDPYKEGRVRFWHPMMHSEIVPHNSTDWARPISTLGGFDDSGVHWVPPAGSLLALLFVNGHRDAGFYVGTVWNRERNSPASFGIPIVEYPQIHAGRRGGYLFGDQAGRESQVLPPSNTESYNGYDITNTASLNTDPDAPADTTEPNIYQMKTNGKHTLRFVDGAKKFDYKWKRAELFSSRGHMFVMKDDHMHEKAQWCNPMIGCDPAFQNPFAKHRSEQMPYCGPPTPNREISKFKLKQSGIHMATLGGHFWSGDDEVEGPYGIPTWEWPFNFGLGNKCLGKTVWGSMTGHTIKMDDKEDEPENRSDVNGIRLESACGQFIEINDHTINKVRAGKKRGIHARSSSLHELEMRDLDNEQASPPRTGPGGPRNEAKDAFVRLRSGYGLMLKFTDSHQQKTTESQTIQLLAPHLTDKKGSHLLQMQLGGGSGIADETGGAVGGLGDSSMVLLRSGNIIVYSSRGISVEAVGDDDNTDNNAHKFVAIKGHHIVQSEGVYVNANKLALIKSKEYIILGAGEDCEEPAEDLAPQEGDGGGFGQAIDNIDIAFGQIPPEADEGPKKGPCLYPIIVAKDPWPCPLTGFIHFGLMCGENGDGYNAMSNRCFASSNPKEKLECGGGEGEGEGGEGGGEE